MQTSPTLGTDAPENEMTIELANDTLRSFVIDAEERGTVRADELGALQLEHDLGD